MADGISKITDILNLLPGVDIKVDDAVRGMADGLRESAKEARDSAAGIKSLDEQWQDFLNTVDQIRGETPISDLFADIKDQSLVNAIKRISGEIEEAMKDTKKKTKKEVDEIKKAFEEAADNLARVFSNAFERFMETGKFRFRDFINDLNNTIRQSVSKSLQTELSKMFQKLLAPDGEVGTQLTNLFTALFGGSTAGFQKTGGGSSGSDNFLGDLFGRIIGGFSRGAGASGGARARGGIEMPFRNFIAGEEGPELITQDGPAGARRVMTAGQTRNRMMREQRPVQVVMNISTPNVESFRQSQSQLASRASMFISRGRRNE